MFSFCAGIASAIATAPIPIAANRATRSSPFSDGLLLGDHVRVEVVRERRGRGQRQAGDHREDGREGDRRDQREQDRAADRAGTAADDLGQQWRGHVALRLATALPWPVSSSAAAPNPRASVIR